MKHVPERGERIAAEEKFQARTEILPFESDRRRRVGPGQTRREPDRDEEGVDLDSELRTDRAPILDREVGLDAGEREPEVRRASCPERSRESS